MLTYIVVISFLAAVTVVIVGDVILWARRYPDTLSSLIRQHAAEHPILYSLWGLLFGVLLGHWFW